MDCKARRIYKVTKIENEVIVLTAEDGEEVVINCDKREGGVKVLN